MRRRWLWHAYPVKESHMMIRQPGPLSAVATQRLSSLMQRQEMMLGWPCGHEEKCSETRRAQHQQERRDPRERPEFPVQSLPLNIRLLPTFPVLLYGQRFSNFPLKCLWEGLP